MDGLLFTLTLEVVLQQMRILEGSTELRIKTWRPSNKLQRLQRNKLVRDREMVQDILRKTLIEIAEEGKWRTLQRAVTVLVNQESVTASLRQSNVQLRVSWKEIYNELDMKRNQWENELRNADRKIASLRDQISDYLRNSNIRLGYAHKWLFARVESLELRFDEPRAPSPHQDHEYRVHQEFLKAYELQIKEREDSLKYWRERYISDIATISARIAEKHNHLRIVNKRREELQKLYDLHAGEMRSWLTFKCERAARLAREERRRVSAVRIQAWWRGLMVRKALGTFKYLRQNKKLNTKSKKK